MWCKVVVKNPADFIGAYIGHSESQTKAILASTVGKVLVIDEASTLYWAFVSYTQRSPGIYASTWEGRRKRRHV